MDKLEKVEKLREKTGVSYEDAKRALEASDYDMLDALIFLEKEGKAGAEAASYTTKEESTGANDFEQAQQEYARDSEKVSAGDVLKKVTDWCVGAVKKCCEIKFEVTRKGKEIIKLPLLVLIIALILAFWITAAALIIGLFCGLKYSLNGLGKVGDSINGMCDKASEACENIKEDIQRKS